MLEQDHEEHPLRKPLFKILLIGLVIGLFAIKLYPPSETLKLGLDLAGGTTLIYQVDVPEGQDSRQVVDQTIATLRKRVDPQGLMNLVWRRQAGNRIEIQIPPPSPVTSQRLEAYLTLRQTLVDGNIDQQQLNSIVRAAVEQGREVIDRVAGDDDHRHRLLSEVIEANRALTHVSGPYQQAQDRLHEVDVELDLLGMGGSAKQREQLQVQRHDAQADLIAKTRLYVDTRNRFQAARDAVLATNVDPARIEQLATLPDKPVQTDPAEEITDSEADGGVDVGEDSVSSAPPITQRQAEINRYKAQHPGRADAIKSAVNALVAYNEVKRGIDDPNDLIAMLRGSGVLEFRIAASADIPGLDVPGYREQLEKRGPKAGTTKPVRWMKIDDISTFADDAEARRILTDNPQAFFANRGLIGEPYGADYYVLLGNRPEDSLTQSQTGWELAHARPSQDQRGFPAVSFQLNRIGGDLMGRLTGDHKGQPMAIVLDGQVISAPTIQSQIRDQGEITGGRGGFDPKEREYLLRTLNAGSLQARVGQEPISVKKFGPQLGQDNLKHGLQASIWAMVLVAILMACYYLFGGMLANFALAANMVIILGAMAMNKAAFTLPGIAGIVLTIGMAVDANVLIFERIREELGRNVKLAEAVRLGYEKALMTIIDANVTTLITCFVLYKMATAEVKGFAITLMIGIVATMFTAIFCTRAIFDLYLLVVKPRSMPTLPALVPGANRLLCPSVNWVGKRYVFFAVSLLAVIASITAVASRGRDLLDIEFRSGTQVTFELAQDKALSIAEVRDRLTTASVNEGLADLAGNRANVVTVGSTDGLHASEFSVATLETDAEAVSGAIKSAFNDVLDVQRPISFARMGDEPSAPPVAQSPVYMILQSSLGANINRPDVHDDVSTHLGGVAIVLEDMDPPPTIAQLEDRIHRMRMQPANQDQGYRSFAVIGLDQEASVGGDAGLNPVTGATSQQRYRSAVVVTSDPEINYLDAPDTFTDPAGLANAEWSLVFDALRRDTTLDSVSNFSSQVSRTMRDQAIVALILSLLAVVAYIWGRFGSIRYGFAAIAALAHDVTIALGLVAAAGLISDTAIGHALMLSDFKINLALVAAVLTIVGYSLNDTIIVFDRIRENRGRLATATGGIINDAINQTISRTVMTSGTTLLAVLTLYLFGGDGVHGFAFAMLLGVVVGTYSSVAIASPILLIGQTDTKSTRTGKSTGVQAAT